MRLPDDGFSTERRLPDGGGIVICLLIAAPLWILGAVLIWEWMH